MENFVYWSTFNLNFLDWTLEGIHHQKIYECILLDLGVLKFHFQVHRTQLSSYIIKDRRIKIIRYLLVVAYALGWLENNSAIRWLGYLSTWVTNLEPQS